MFEKKYEFNFLRKEYGTMYLVKTVKSNELNPTVRIGIGTFKVLVGAPTFSRKNAKVFFFNYDTGAQLVYEEIKSFLNPSELDLIVSNQIIKELTAGAMQDKKQKIIDMILGGVIGALLSAVLMFFYMQQQIADIYAEMPTFNTIGGV